MATWNPPLVATCESPIRETEDSRMKKEIICENRLLNSPRMPSLIHRVGGKYPAIIGGFSSSHPGWMGVASLLKKNLGEKWHRILEG